jgi:hypothetical protein
MQAPKSLGLVRKPVQDIPVVHAAVDGSLGEDRFSPGASRISRLSSNTKLS